MSGSPWKNFFRMISVSFSISVFSLFTDTCTTLGTIKILYEFISFKGLKTFSMEPLLKLPRNRYKNLYISLSCSERLNIRNTWKLEIIYSWNIGNLLFQRTLRMFMYIWPHPTKPIQSNCSFHGGLTIYKI